MVTKNLSLGSLSRFARKVRTASGAIAVQVVVKDGGRVVDVDHVGSAHTDGAPHCRVRRPRDQPAPPRSHQRLDQKIVQTLRTVRSATIEIRGQRLTLDPETPTTANDLLKSLGETGH